MKAQEMDYERQYKEALEISLKSRGHGWFIDRFQKWPVMWEEIEVAVDAGAFVGWWSIGLSKFLSDQQAPTIYAVEPINHEALALKTGKFKNIITVPFGLLDKTEVKSFHGMADGSRISKSPSEIERAHTEALCLTWPDFIKKYDIKKVDLLKVDVEGSEKLLFKGMEGAEVLPKYIELEVHPQYLKGLHGQDLWGHANLWKEFPLLTEKYEFLLHYKWGSFFEAKNK